MVTVFLMSTLDTITRIFHLTSGPVEVPFGARRILLDGTPVECVGAAEGGAIIWETLADGPALNWANPEPFNPAGTWIDDLNEADLIPAVTVNWDRIPSAVAA